MRTKLHAAMLATGLVLAARLAGAATEVCIESQGTALPPQIIVDQLNVAGDTLLWTNIWGMRGYANDDLRQCLFVDGEEFGWTWTKAETDPVCAGPSCPGLACMYQFSFGSMEYGISPWGTSSGAVGLPVRTGELASLVVGHDLDYQAVDAMPGLPGPIYARHSLVYDLFLSTSEPQAGVDVSSTLTDEIIIMLNFNPEYPDFEGCSTTASDPVEANAVFDGFHWYDYHSVQNTNPIAGNYHQFRRSGGDSPVLSVPANLDIAPFLHYLRRTQGDYTERWLGKVTIGSQLYDHTSGSVTFRSHPTFEIVEYATPKESQGASVAVMARGGGGDRDRLVWRMSRADAASLSDLGDPRATTTYNLLVEAGDLVVDLPLPADPTRWTIRGRVGKEKGIVYKDKELSHAGVARLRVDVGADGKSKVRLKAKGAGIGLPSSLSATTPIRVTLSNSAGSRWVSTFETASANSTQRIKAKF